jgi:hypothetical protein
MSIKWTSFTTGGELSVGNQVVGLSSNNLNRRFDFPGTGIKDATGVYLLRWLPAISTASNYITFSNAITTTSPTIAASGADASVGLQLVSKGAGNITISTSSTGYTIIDSTSAMQLPVGTTAQRPTGLAGLIRYNSTLGAAEFWNGSLAQWSTSVNSVVGTSNRITVTGSSSLQVDIASTYAGQGTITTVGTITVGLWRGTTVEVIAGGTGVTGINAYEIMCGGTAAAAPITTVGSTGITGQILSSNGPGALPSWQTGNILGRTSSAAVGYVGETVSYVLATQTNMTAVGYTNFPTNIITPSFTAGVWLISLDGNGTSTGAPTIQYRLVANNGSDTTILDMPFVIATANAYFAYVGTTVLVSSGTTTVRLQGIGSDIYARAGTSIRAVRIA